MKINLVDILNVLGWPVALVGVLSAVLVVFGVSLDQVLAIAETMIGLWAILSLTINVLKVVGAIDPGTSGKWSAVLNLVAVIGIAFVLANNPAFDFARLDAQLQIIAQFGALLLTFVTNALGTQAMHKFQTRILGIRAFRFAV